MDSTLNALHLIVNASVVVQIIMAILVVLSVLSWYAIFSKSAALRRAQAQSDGFEREFLSAQNIGHLFQGSLNNRAQAGSLERIFIAGMQGFEQASGQHPNARLEFAQRSMKATFQREIDGLETQLPFLASVGSVSPYIGLLGTVWGIMSSFHSIGMLKSASLATVAPGISEALVATAIGLAVAVPATIGFNIFMGKLSQVDTLLVNFAGVFLNRVQREINAHRPVQRTGATEM